MLKNASNHFLLDYGKFIFPYDEPETEQLAKQFVSHLVCHVHSEYLQTMQAVAGLKSQRSQHVDALNTMPQDQYLMLVMQQLSVTTNAEEVPVDERNDELLSWRSKSKRCADLLVGGDLKFVFATEIGRGSCGERV